MKPTLIMLCGVAGSGKSTYSRRSVFDNFLKLNNDDYILECMKRDDITYQESFNTNILQAEFELVENLKAGIVDEANILLDQMNLTATSRRKKLLRIPPTYNKIAVNFLESEEVLMNRNQERLKQGLGIPESILKVYLGKYSPAEVKEGFDEIWTPNDLINL